MPRKRTKAAQTAPTENIFEALARHGRSMNPNTETEPAPPAARSGAAPDAQALLERLDRLEQQNQDLQRRLVLASPAPAPQRTDPAPMTGRDVPLKFDDIIVQDTLSGNTVLKDPAELAKRITAYVQAQEHATRQELEARSTAESTQRQTEERLWSAFSERYPEWTDHQDLVELVSGKVAADARARGVDPQRYILQNSDIFFADVAAQLQKQYGKMVEGEDDGENEAADGTPEHLMVGRAAPDLNPLDDGRTAGIFGGQDSGGQPARRKGAAVAEPAGNEMEKDLQAVQSKLGLY